MTNSAKPAIEMVALDRLIPYARNAKKHDERQVAAIAASIREFGFCSPILIDAADGIIAGHGRALGAKLAGLAEVPCIRLAHLTENQKRAYILADNRLAETGGGWNIAELEREVESIDFDSLNNFSKMYLELEEMLNGEESISTEGDAEKGEEALTAYGHVHVLLSMTPDVAAKHLPGLIESAKSIGAEVNHAGN